MLHFAQGSATTELTEDDLRAALRSVFDQLGSREKILAVPPDYTRVDSRAGLLTCMTHEYYGEKLVDVLPALGTHVAMSDTQLQKMFPGVPRDKFRIHRWRSDVVTLGHVPAEFVKQVTEGIWDQPWPVQLNRLIREGGHDLILSLGQVVPHEVIGMANYNKNLFVGTGGAEGINESHFIGAAYGMERIMGRADNPLRRILNRAEELFCSDLPIVYLLTVIGPTDDGRLVVRGLFIGDDPECFFQAAKLSAEVNITLLDEPLDRVVVYLDPEKYHSTWLGNKAIYRTRMAMADGGELLVIAPGVTTFGEDPEIDRLIRKHGYRKTAEIMQLVEQDDSLRKNLSAAAHLIHGSSEGRFTITYAPGNLSREAIEGVGYRYVELEAALREFDVTTLHNGPNELDGQSLFYVSDPAQGLWVERGKHVVDS